MIRNVCFVSRQCAIGSSGNLIEEQDIFIRENGYTAITK